jgi:hypothetical protein
MTFSQFVAHWTANRRHVAASVAEEVRRAAVARLQERMSDGGANAPLCFADLVQRMEAARFFKVNGRTVRRWISGEQPIPEAVAIALWLMIRHGETMSSVVHSRNT